MTKATETFKIWHFNLILKCFRLGFKNLEEGKEHSGNFFGMRLPVAVMSFCFVSKSVL